MRNSIILLCCTLLLPLFTLNLSAQSAQGQRQNNRRMNMQEFEKRKREFVQKEAGLNQDEANKYFPLSSELTQKKFELHKQHREKVQRIRENSNISDGEYRKLLENDVDIKVKEAALDKEYAAKFEKVLTPEKLFKAQQAERDFMQSEVANFRRAREEKRVH